MKCLMPAGATSCSRQNLVKGQGRWAEMRVRSCRRSVASSLGSHWAWVLSFSFPPLFHLKSTRCEPYNILLAVFHSAYDQSVTARASNTQSCINPIECITLPRGADRSWVFWFLGAPLLLLGTPRLNGVRRRVLGFPAS